MPAIGFVTRTDNGFEGNLKTLTIKAPIVINQNDSKTDDNEPDYLVFVEGSEIGAGWIRASKKSGKEYVSLKLAAPEFGPKQLQANLGVAAGQDDPDSFAIIGNPAD